MSEIIYTDHLRLRLNIRKIPYEYPKIIYSDADQRFFDVLEGKDIAVKKLKYTRRIRNMMIAFEKKGNVVEIVTIHPISDEKILNRIMSGRWKKNG